MGLGDDSVKFSVARVPSYILSFLPEGAETLRRIMSSSSEHKIPAFLGSPRLRRYLPVLTEVWIFGTIAVFFAIRILGSNTVQHFLRSKGH